MEGLPPSRSAVETTHLILPPDTNSVGTAFGGRIMQWMDIAAGIAAARHACGSVVTVAVDELVFERPIGVGDVIVIKACVNFAGKTSMEVGVRVDRDDEKTRHMDHCLTGYFTFVAVDEKMRPRPVGSVVPESPSEKRRYQNAQTRRQRRLDGRIT